MAGSLADYAEKAAIDWLLGGAAPTRPGTLYLGLFTAAPGEAGGGTEVSGNGYGRQPITFGAAVIGNGAGNGVPVGTTQSVSSNAPTFTAAGGDWGTIVNFAIFDAATNGNEIIYANLNTSRQVKDGDTISFPAGQISFALD